MEQDMLTLPEHLILGQEMLTPSEYQVSTTGDAILAESSGFMTGDAYPVGSAGLLRYDILNLAEHLTGDASHCGTLGPEEVSVIRIFGYFFFFLRLFYYRVSRYCHILLIYLWYIFFYIPTRTNLVNLCLSSGGLPLLAGYSQSRSSPSKPLFLRNVRLLVANWSILDCVDTMAVNGPLP